MPLLSTVYCDCNWVLNYLGPLINLVLLSLITLPTAPSNLRLSTFLYAHFNFTCHISQIIQTSRLSKIPFQYYFPSSLFIYVGFGSLVLAVATSSQKSTCGKSNRLHVSSIAYMYM